MIASANRPPPPCCCSRSAAASLALTTSVRPSMFPDSIVAAPNLDPAAAYRPLFCGNEVALGLSGPGAPGTDQGSAHEQLQRAHRRRQHRRGQGQPRHHPRESISHPERKLQHDQRAQWTAPGTPTIDTLGLSLSYIVDFWGQYRRATEQARAILLGTEYARSVVIITLISMWRVTIFCSANWMISS